MVKADLDKRICDCVEGATNEQTYREFIVETEKEFFGVHADLDSMNDEQLNAFLKDMDDMWYK